MSSPCLRSHKQLNHGETATCEKCNKVFGSKKRLSKHINDVHSIRNLKCPHCDYQTNRQRNLTDHVLSVHEKPLVCEYCKKSFGKQHILEIHINHIHNDVKTFQCENCNEMFASQRLLTGNFFLERNKNHPWVRKFEAI